MFREPILCLFGSVCFWMICKIVSFRVFVSENRISDLFNSAFYDGKPVFSGENLVPANNEYNLVVTGPSEEDICLTLVLYFGETWDGFIDLHGLLGLDDECDIFKKYIPNYQINMVNARELCEKNTLKTDLQLVFGMLNYEKDAKGLKQYIKNSHSDKFKNFDIDSYNAIKTLLGATKLPNFNELMGTERRVDMCKAIDDMCEESAREGEIRGEIKGKIEGKVEGKIESLTVLIRKKHIKGLGLSDIAEVLEEPEEDIAPILIVIQENPNDTINQLVEKLTRTAA